jgi:hypothetical protein
VAVLLAAAEHVKQKKEIPPLNVKDDLYLALFDDSNDVYGSTTWLLSTRSSARPGAGGGKRTRPLPRAYEEAAGYLRRMHNVYQTTRRLPDWQNLLLELRGEHKANRRLMEALDCLSGKKLVD